MKHVLLTAGLVLAALFGALTAASDPWTQSVVRIPMRDGVGLSANVFRPASAGRVPAILARTPYGKGAALLPGYDLFVRSGYAVVIQDVRGRGQSEGTFRMMHQEEDDGADTLEWIARQSWSDGRIAMAGASYLGIAQWKAALSGNQHLRAIAPVVAGNDDYLDRMYSRGGGLKLGHRLSWMTANLRARGLREPLFSKYVHHLPLRTADAAATGRTIAFWQDAMDHPRYDAYWRAISTREQFHRVRTPALIVSGWYDNYVESDLDSFERLAGRVPARLIVGPWAHNTGEMLPHLGLPPDALLPLRRVQLAWFDRHVKGVAVHGNEPPVRIFVMGANRWRDEHAWPLERARQTAYYLGSSGKLLARPDGSAPDQYTYDPRNPVPTLGGAVCCNPRVFPWGPRDQRTLESRRDVLVYSTPPLVSDLEVTGAVRVVLRVSTSAPDTDFTAKLVDVYPDGRAINLCDGMLRLRYRESLDREVLSKPGQIHRIAIEAGVTSNLFRAGHRIRVEVSSSNFPRFDRNPNTGRPIADETELRPARQTVYHDRSRPSYVLLPVVP